jgi:hypothetical protein
MSKRPSSRAGGIGKNFRKIFKLQPKGTLRQSMHFAWWTTISPADRNPCRQSFTDHAPHQPWLFWPMAFDCAERIRKIRFAARRPRVPKPILCNVEPWPPLSLLGIRLPYPQSCQALSDAKHWHVTYGETDIVWDAPQQVSVLPCNVEVS